MSINWKLLDDDKVLRDRYPVYRGFVYIVDGVITRCLRDGTVSEWKEEDDVKVIRKCDIVRHLDARLGDTIRR